MSAPNLKEIEWAISELEKEESSFPVYAKLANLYTVRNEMLNTFTAPKITAYSEADAPGNEKLGQYGDSDFLQAIAGRDGSAAWKIMDELMDTLHVVNVRVYDSVMRKIRQI